MNDLSPQQAAVLNEVRHFVRETLKVTDKRWTDWYLLRFCRARKFEVIKVKEMINNFIKWFTQMKFDSIGELNIGRFDKLRENAGFGYYNTDKLGRPIYIDQVKRLKVKEVFEDYSDEDLMSYYIQSYDRLIHVIFPECSRVAGKRIEQTCSILDLNGMNIFKLFTGKIKAFTKIATDISQDYYPEILGNMFIVNSGMLFSGIWIMVKPWIDPKTQAKIKIISGSGKKELAETVALENLPVFLGGTCTRDTSEDFGPWKDALVLSQKNKTIFHHDQKLVNHYFSTEEEKKQIEENDRKETEQSPF